MKKIALTIIALSIAVAGVAQKEKKSESKNKQSNNKNMTKQKKSFEDSVSYAIGFNIASNIASENFHYNLDEIYQGMKDVMDKATPAFTQEEMMTIMNEWQMKMEETQNVQKSAASKGNKDKGAKFLAENKTKNPAVKETPSGLQYLVVVEGTGAKPAAADVVKVHYKGTTIDGNIFDSSYERGEPISFPLNQVIPGWTEGLQLMSVGSKYIFYIPSDLAYGDNGAGGAIAPGETLIFEVELLEINPK